MGNLRTGQEADAAPARTEQMRHHKRRAAGIIDAHVAAAGQSAVDQNYRIVPFRQIGQGLLGQARTPQHHPIDGSLFEGAQQLGFTVRVFHGIAQQETIAGRMGRVIGPVADVGKEWVGDVGNDQADGACVARGQAVCDAAGTIIEPVDDFLDTVEGGVADLALAVERGKRSAGIPRPHVQHQQWRRETTSLCLAGKCGRIVCRDRSRDRSRPL